MYYVYILAGIAVAVSWLASPAKTMDAFKIAAKRFFNVMPAMLVMLALVSLLPTQMSDTAFIGYLGNHSEAARLLLASFIGSITVLPGFIAFPLGRILLEKGVSYMVLSGFTTTLMMVGIVTYPVEQAYLGHKAAILRNIISFGIALVVALMTGMLFGEVI